MHSNVLNAYSDGSFRYQERTMSPLNDSPPELARSSVQGLIEVDLLRSLYLDQALSLRAIAELLGVSRARLRGELASAGIPIRTKTERRSAAQRARLPRHTLHRLYVEEDLSIREVARRLAEAPETIRRRLHEEGLVKVRGNRGRGLAGADRARTAREAVWEYLGEGLTATEVAAQLGISTSLVLQLLHESNAPLRYAFVAGTQDRSVLESMYADARIVSCLERWGVPMQDPDSWQPPAAFERYAPDPLPGPLVGELYGRIGLSLVQVALLLGVSAALVRRRLGEEGVSLRSSERWAPWTKETFGANAVSAPCPTRYAA